MVSIGDSVWRLGRISGYAVAAAGREILSRLLLHRLFTTRRKTVEELPILIPVAPAAELQPLASKYAPPDKLARLRLFGPQAAIKGNAFKFQFRE